jgi:hypothetical protein
MVCDVETLNVPQNLTQIKVSEHCIFMFTYLFHYLFIYLIMLKVVNNSF